MFRIIPKNIFYRRVGDVILSVRKTLSILRDLRNDSGNEAEYYETRNEFGLELAVRIPRVEVYILNVE